MKRRSYLAGAAVVSMAAILSFGAVLFSVSCSGGGTGSGADAEITVETSSMWVTVGNKAGMPVTDMTVEIVPVGGATVYSTTYYRLEDGNTHDFPVNGFRGRDGTPFDLRVAKPKSVRVSCKGVDGKPRTVETPWR
ncbi:MAG: hypothetical protein EHM13_02010 [Acidobacteria bacterium]|nr:MAG: hypothetical protein EHM13_02010 [Acidobacteriota bacterium]